MTLDEKKLRKIIRQEIKEAVTSFPEEVKWEQEIKNKTGEHASVRLEWDNMLKKHMLVLLVGEKRGQYDTFFYLDERAAKELSNAMDQGLRQLKRVD